MSLRHDTEGKCLNGHSLVPPYAIPDDTLERGAERIDSAAMETVISATAV
jgi:hypothetical protein